MMFELTGKTALITGASRGIGEASAVALDRAGARVVLTGCTTSDLERVANTSQHDPLSITADMAPAGAGGQLAQEVIAQCGGVDILVNNAGIPIRRRPEQLTEQGLDRGAPLKIVVFL
ncbi:MAG: SDR family NAD(P)-dependent oxidoreductase [Gammaproteobacteria bacterium]|nr:SDR family NAD(P)-dependent oxidoreductase [Gammaproteobacteria bacterium]